MLRLFYLNIIFAIAFLQINILCQSKTTESNKYYTEGITALRASENDSAEVYFKKSVREYSDASSYYELAKIYEKKNTVSSRIRARDYIQKAILKDPHNTDYIFLMARLAERISSLLAARYYEDIIAVDSSNSNALYQLGRINEGVFDEYHNSYTKDKDDIQLSHEKYADKYFKKAENFLNRAIKCDSLNANAYLHLGFLFEDAGEPEKGIPFLVHLNELRNDDPDAHLYLGLLYYETSHIEESFHEFQNALVLMSDSERQDFIYNSVKELLEPVLGEKFKSYSRLKIKEIIDYFWKYSDPLYLTDYNERLLEHYSRVAYANLRFGVKYKNEPGWRTDRGEMILRYGRPDKRIRYRPQMSADEGGVISMKTDVWYYDNFVLGFTDQFMSGNFVFSEPEEGKRFMSQFPGETNLYVNYIRKAQYSAYKPKFEGPSFKIPLDIVQFKNEQTDNYNFTDVYVNYGVQARDSLNNPDGIPYEWGLFFFDLNLNPVHREKGTVAKYDNANIFTVPGEKELYSNSRMMTLWPDSGELAFEIIREKDKGVSSNHRLFNVRKFKTDELDMSDLFMAYNITEGDSSPAPVKRGNISVFPNPTNTFNQDLPIYVYYEIYNLTPDKKGFSDFEQSLILTKKEPHSEFADVLNSVVSLVGLGRKENQIVIGTDYKTREKNPRMYFQVDMNNYPPGQYDLTIRITDKISGKQIESTALLIWK